jgi:hypothetical protein
MNGRGVVTLAHTPRPRKSAAARALPLLGLALLPAVAALALAQPPTPVVPQKIPAQGARNSRALAALNRALQLQRQGDLEEAGREIRLASSLQAELTEVERSELAGLIEFNRVSLESRKQARELLDQAEVAVRDGQPDRARGLCRRLVGLERSLADSDRQRMAEVARASGFAGPGGTLPRVADAQAARTKLQQARVLLSQGHFDAAEQLAREAGEGVKEEFGPREDNPDKVIADVARARKDPQSLLAASRVALKEARSEKDFDRAEKLADAAERNASAFSFKLWSDSPAKVKKDIQAARAAAAPATAPAKPAEKKQPEAKEKSGPGLLAPVAGLFSKDKSEKTETPPAPAAEKKEKVAEKTLAEGKSEPAAQPGGARSVMDFFKRKSEQPEKKTDPTPAPAVQEKTPTKSVETRKGWSLFQRKTEATAKTPAEPKKPEATADLGGASLRPEPGRVPPPVKPAAPAPTATAKEAPKAPQVRSLFDRKAPPKTETASKSPTPADGEASWLQDRKPASGSAYRPQSTTVRTATATLPAARRAPANEHPKPPPVTTL